jgi:glycosyltransferase involved in cell wall biosynthesis
MSARESGITAFVSGGARPRLLYIASDAPFFVTHFLLLGKAACSRGYEVHVAAPLDPQSGRGDEEAQLRIEQSGLFYHRISLKRAGTNPFRELLNIRSFARLLDEVRPDLVHCLGIKPVIFAGALARLRGLPAIHAVIGLGLPFMGKGAAARLRIAVLLRGFAFAFGNKRSRVTIEHNEDRNLLLGARAVEESRLARLHGVGADLDLFHPREDDRETGVPPVVMFAARLIEPKGVREFVAAAERLKAKGLRARFVLQCQLDLNNPNAIAEAEVRAWHDRGLIEWWGSTSDMPNALRKADIFCLPTYYREGTPKALIEAAATGLPIVTTDVAGCRDVVMSGENGILITPRSLDELEAALAKLIGDEAFREQAGRKSRDIAVARYDVQAFIATSLELYAQLVPVTAPPHANGAPSLAV